MSLWILEFLGLISSVVLPREIMVAAMTSSLGAKGSVLRKRIRREITVAPMSSSLGAMGPLLRKLDSLLAPDCRRLPRLLKKKIRRLKRDLLEDISTPFVELSKVQAPDLPAKSWMTEVRELSYDLSDSIDAMTIPVWTDAGAKTGTTTVRRYCVRCTKIARLPSIQKRRTRLDIKLAQLRTSLLWEAIERHDRYLQNVHNFSASTMIGHRSAIGPRVPRVKISRLATAPKRCAKVLEMVSHRTGEWEPSDEHESYQNIEGCCSPISSHMFIAAQNLFGIENSSIQLTNRLKDESKQNLEVVSIVGSGGIGKTTLAMELYREVCGLFECRAFVRASQKPNMRNLLWGILTQIQPHQQPSRASTVQDLIDGIRRHLQDKRYLVVVDDLWHPSIWDIIVSGFPDCDTCSRIIMTTEIVDTAQEICSFQSNYIFKMKSLGNDESRRIFLKTVFGSEYRSHKQLEEVSYEMTRRCGGLPLTTVTAASLVKVLARQPKNSDAWSNVQNFVSSILEKNPNPEGMMKEVLNLSYSCLPQYLKTCLLYLSIYPEGYTIWKADLLKQWMAEDFIVPTQGKDRKEVAETYFNELINRRMIDPNNLNHIDGALSCTVHPIILNVIKCKSKEQNFTTVIDYPQIITGLSTKVRRLSLLLSSAKHAIKPASVAMSHVRSLAFFGLLECMPLLRAFKLLRVLILEIWGHQECTSLDLTRISALIHLRYIKITCDAMVELPNKMVGLQNLETLELDARVSSIPLDIIYLPRLLHLCLRYVECLPDGIGRIRSLRALQYFDLGNNSENNIWSLGQLTNLQDLHLTCSAPPSDEHLKRNLVALAFSLGKLSRLKSLTMAPSSPGAGMSFEGPSTVSPPVFIQRLELLPPTCIFTGLPVWLGQFRKLHVLKIAVRELRRNEIDCLGSLPALIALSLHVQVARMGTVIIKRASFPALQYFSFRCRVLCMAFRAGAMPNLQKLEIGFKVQAGKQYGRMLGGIEHLQNLQDITGEIATATAASDRCDWKVADTAFRNAVEVSRQKWHAKGQHSTFPRVHVKWAEWMVVDEAFAHHVEGSRGLGTTSNRDLCCEEFPFELKLLPKVISFTSPLDACRCLAVCTAFRAEASRDEVWERFIPADYRSILSGATDPVDVDFASTKKELFTSLSEEHILIDEGHKSFWLDRTTGAKSYMLAAKSLNITWGGTPQYWRWIAVPDSRFEEVAELVRVCWLDITATIDCRELSPNTRYTACLVFNLTDRSYGLDSPTQACITIASCTAAEKHTVSLYPRAQQQRSRVGSRPHYLLRHHWEDEVEDQDDEYEETEVEEEDDEQDDVEVEEDEVIEDEEEEEEEYYIDVKKEEDEEHDMEVEQDEEKEKEEDSVDVVKEEEEEDDDDQEEEEEDNNNEKDSPLLFPHSFTTARGMQEMPPSVRGSTELRDLHECEQIEELMRYPRARSDDWMEVELGQFYIENLDDGAVEICLKEHDDFNWKSGLIIEGIEIRPVTGSNKPATAC